jgi:hypothetical protein
MTSSRSFRGDLISRSEREAILGGDRPADLCLLGRSMTFWVAKVIDKCCGTLRIFVITFETSNAGATVADGSRQRDCW